jgi:hypothetical protein
MTRFSEDRIDELLQASNDLSEGDEIKYEDARDLAIYLADENERIRNIYQHRLMDLANAAVRATHYPEIAKALKNLPKPTAQNYEPLP